MCQMGKQSDAKSGCSVAVAAKEFHFPKFSLLYATRKKKIMQETFLCGRYRGYTHKFSSIIYYTHETKYTYVRVCECIVTHVSAIKRSIIEEYSKSLPNIYVASLGFTYTLQQYISSALRSRKHPNTKNKNNFR